MSEGQQLLNKDDQYMKAGVCDYVAKYQYAEYNKCLQQIPDDPSQLEQMHKDLKAAFKTGRTRDMDFRKQQLKSLQQGLEEMKEELCDAIAKDLGRGGFTSFLSEVHYCIAQIQHTIDHMHEWSQPKIVNTPIFVGPGQSSIVPEPLGVIAVLGAWNYPVSLLVGPLQEVIGAGNCAIIKPPEFSPHTAFAMAKFFKKYLDNKYYKCYLGQAQVAIKMTSMKWDMVVFTGSSQKGKLVAQACAKNLVPTVLELGGKSPTIIDESANATYAAKKILFGKLPNCGQICISPDYIYCHESKIQEFITAMKEQLKIGYNNGDTVEENGKLVNEFHYNRVCDLLKDHGGEVVFGNPNAPTDKNLKPTLVLNPSKNSPIMTEEIFGPLFPVFTYKNLDEPLEYIYEAQEKPLVVYYFGAKGSANQIRVEKETSSGAFVCNDCLIHMVNNELPFGGVGYSGQGRCHGETGFQNFSNMKSVLVKAALDFFPFNLATPPFDEEKKKQIIQGLSMGAVTQYQIYQVLMMGVYSAVFLIFVILFREQLGYFIGHILDGSAFKP